MMNLQNNKPMELWIARDYLDGCLYIYTEKPYLVSKSYFDTRNGEKMRIGDSSRLKEITFENSPQKVKLKLL